MSKDNIQDLVTDTQVSAFINRYNRWEAETQEEQRAREVAYDREMQRREDWAREQRDTRDAR